MKKIFSCLKAGSFGVHEECINRWTLFKTWFIPKFKFAAPATLAIAIKMVLSTYFYYFYYGTVINTEGVWLGSGYLFTLQLIIMIAFVYVYDLIGFDLFRISAIKNNYKSKHQHSFVGWKKVRLTIIAFVTLLMLLGPYITVLCIRKEGRYGMRLREYVEAILCICIATTYWTFVFHKGMIGGSVFVFHWLVN